jgi:IclR family pca regulon transcriptional regulator
MAMRAKSPKTPKVSKAGSAGDNASAVKSKSSVQSLGKAFRLLEAIAAAEEDLTLSEIAAASDLDPGTTHRMLNTMVDLGYIDRAEGKRFALTLKVLDLGFRAIGRRDMRSIARPILRSLVGEVSEAASLGVLSGSDVLYVERVRAGITRLGVDIRIGTLIPAISSVIGWSILAFLPEEEVSHVLNMESRQREFQEMTKLPDVRQILTDIRKQGYALSASHVSNGLVVLAAPVRDEDGYPIAAISVAAPTLRMNLDELKARALVSVTAAATSIGRGLSASGGIVAA